MRVSSWSESWIIKMVPWGTTLGGAEDSGGISWTEAASWAATEIQKKAIRATRNGKRRVRIDIGISQGSLRMANDEGAHTTMILKHVRRLDECTRTSRSDG